MKLPDWIVDNHKTVGLVFIIAILIYLAYVLWWSDGVAQNIEGFAAHELTDLLDKIRVNIYDNKSVWNNKFYNNQPGRKEKPLSFWSPLLSDGDNLPSGLKILGTCVSDKTDYDAPNDTTMLVKGDVKAPISANEVFKFPHNELTRPRLDDNGNPITRFVLNGIEEIEDIDKRIKKLESYLSQINGIYDNIKSNLGQTKSEIDKYTEFNVIAYGPESYFKSALYGTKIKDGQEIRLPEGTYQSLRVPIGSSGTLIFEDGHTDTFSYPYSGIIDPSNPDKYKYEGQQGKQLTYKDVNDIGADIQKWMITGSYGLGFRRGGTATNIFFQGKGRFGVAGGDGSHEYATSVNYGFGDQSNPEFEGLYGYGKSDLIDYFNEFITPVEGDPTNRSAQVLNKPNKENRGSADLRKPENLGDTKVYLGQQRDAPNFWFVLPNTDPNAYNINTWENRYRFWEGTSGATGARQAKNITIIESPHLLQISNNLGGFDDLSKEITNLDATKTKISSENNWFAPAVDGYIQTNKLSSGLKVKQVYIDLAFRLFTKKKTPRTDVNCASGKTAAGIGGKKCNCCNIADDKWVGLTAGNADHGPLKSAIIRFDASINQIPFYRYYNTLNATITKYIDDEIAAAYKQLAQLYDFQTLINNNQLEPFPLRIIRPSPPSGYVSLGDILFNHRDPGYTAKLPIINRFACVPAQCVREMREWLITDKVYEYNRDGKYLGIYKNPYLQTFRATTVAGVLPPGKVVKIVACVEKCKLVDEILTADKCARKFYNSNKAVIEATNLDNDNVVLSRESAIYQDKIRERQDKITELQDVARKLQVQDDKAEIVNREFNRDKLQNLIGKQQSNIAHLGNRLKDDNGQIDINLKFDYAKFMELIYKLPDSIPAPVKKKIIDIVDTSAGQKLDALPDDVVNAVLAQCPTPETQGLVRKSLVESGCYGCVNLQ